MARASGLALVDGRNDPLRASTRGTGELIAVARREGYRRMLVAVGGSATTDGGLAAVETLGWSLQGAEVTVACDVESAFQSPTNSSPDEPPAQLPTVDTRAEKACRALYTLEGRQPAPFAAEIRFVC